MISDLRNMAKRRTVRLAQALELILQRGSDDETEVDHYESSNESVEEEDFMNDVPENDGDPDYVTDEEGGLDDEVRSDTDTRDNEMPVTDFGMSY